VSAAPGDFAGTYTGYLSTRPSGGLVESYYSVLTVNSSGLATLSAHLGNPATAMVNSSGYVTFNNFNFGYGDVTMKISRVGKINTGATGYGAGYFDDANYGVSDFVIALQNPNANPQPKVTPPLAAGNYAFLAKGDVEYGFADRVGSGTLIVGKTSWTGSITIAHQTVSLSGSLGTDGALKVVRPAKFASSKISIVPFTINSNYIGFHGRFKDHLNGITLDLLGVKTR